MTLNIAKQVAAMERMTVDQLRAKYADVFGESPRSRHKAYLIKRIIWRQQANEEGDLSERARRRAMELANDAELRVTAPREPKSASEKGRTVTKRVHRRRDNRTLLPGTMITRQYKGDTLVVNVLHDGFEYEGEVYRSLSAVAKAITGTHWNGYHFFNLRKKGALA